ncbi:MAG: type II secretion system major pseudopilin GspG [Chthoniobacterales bacterium]
MNLRENPPLIRRSFRGKGGGFTLLEIMLVVTIIALLLGAAIYKLSGNVEYARHTRVGADIQGISTQLKVYESMNGFYPSTEQGLQALVTQASSDPKPSRWYQLYTSLPRDPWQNNYVYRSPGTKNPTSYDLFSPGPDHTPDTPDDDWGD